MSSTVIGSPAGSPSTITTSAWPWDSPAVRKRSIAEQASADAPVRPGGPSVGANGSRGSAGGELDESAAARIAATSGVPGPQLLLQRRLVDEHPEAVDRPRARRARRRAAARVSQRVVDEVGDDLAGTQQRRVERQRRLVAAHPDARWR